jgi:rhodanese-related sulfurtransferase
MNLVKSIGIICLLPLVLTWSSAYAQEVNFISVDQLYERLDDPNVMIIDVRQPDDWAASDKKIKGAVRRLPKAFDAWFNEFPKNKKLVFY